MRNVRWDECGPDDVCLTSGCDLDGLSESPDQLYGVVRMLLRPRSGTAIGDKPVSEQQPPAPTVRRDTHLDESNLIGEVSPMNRGATSRDAGRAERHTGAVQGPIEFEFASSLEADVHDVWRVVTTMKGVTSELHPFVHMTSGPEHQTLPTDVAPGQVMLKSWLLLFHVLPFDRHSLALDHIEHDRGFAEESSSWLQRRWRHERPLAPNQDHGCLIADRLVIEPRLRLGRPLVSLIVKLLFHHRHRRLKRHFG